MKQKIYHVFNLRSLLFLLDIILFLINSSNPKSTIRYLKIYHFSQVHLIIEGIGIQKILSDEFIYEPSEVLVNGETKGNICKKTCELDNEKNNITLRFDQLTESCANMFFNISNIKQIDLSEFDSSKVRNMSYMFYNCSNLEKIIFGNINTSLVKDMHYLFYSCSKLTSIDLSNFDTSSVTNMEGMFIACHSLQSINLSTFNTSSVETMRSLFGGCSNIMSLDLSYFDFTRVTSFYLMFSNASSLRTINFGHSKAKSLLEIRSMFYECKNLISVDLSNFNTSLVSDMKWVFFNCYSLKHIYFSELFDTSNAIDMKSMFANCRTLISLNLSSFDTSKVSNMNFLFSGCENLKYLDLSSFSSEKVETILSIFENCRSLIYLNFFSLRINSETNIGSALNSINFEAIFCVNDSYTENRLLSGYISSCSDICFQKDIKLDIELNQCIETCEEHNYTYECNNICYNQCPENSYISIDNPKICLDREPPEYYLDLNESMYKKCFKRCIYCYGKGDEYNHNCKKCKSGLIFLNDKQYKNNCYEKCEYYYYFNESNNYLCTENYICPENYKLIPDKKKCIEECKNDDLYKYELNKTCYKECPFGTLPIDYTCKSNESFTDILTKEIIYSYINTSEEDINYIKETETNKLITFERYFNKIENLSNNNTNEIEISVNISIFDIYKSSVIENYTNISNIHELDILLKYLQNLLENGYDLTEIDKGNDFIYYEGNISFTITSARNQIDKKNKNNNVTTIDLGKCENILRENYNISEQKDLYILKIDKFLEGLNIPKIEYEIYYPLIENKLQKVNLSLCSNIKIDISIPINISLNEIDKYNSSSNLYNNICYTLTTESGTDISLKDRREEFVNNNISVCEEDCFFSEYDERTKKAVCSCFTKINLPLITEIKVDKKKFFNNFIDLNNIANIKVLKCIRFLFKKENVFKNSSNYLSLFLFSIGTCSIFIYCFKTKETISNYLEQIFNENKINNNKVTFITSSNNIRGCKKKIEKKRVITETKNKKSKYNAPPKSKDNKKRQKAKIVKIEQTTKNSEINTIINGKSISINKNKNNKKMVFKNKQKKFETEKSDFALKGESPKQKEKELNKNYTDIEMNLLKFEEAIKCDYRTYWEYYLSLLKTKHLLIFTFWKVKDYNSRIIKIYIFFFTFFINYAVSAMFYSDSTMHKIYEEHGSFNFIYQIPQMLYSSIISSVLKTILNILGLFGNNLIEIRNMKQEQKNQKIIKVSMVIALKIIFFFIITYLLLFFFWIYLGCFCVVFKNTQIHLLIEVLSSFAISFIIYFVIYLLPGIFRILSLYERKNDRPYLYKLSKLLQMV